MGLTASAQRRRSFLWVYRNRKSEAPGRVNDFGDVLTGEGNREDFDFFEDRKDFDFFEDLDVAFEDRDIDPAPSLERFPNLDFDDWPREWPWDVCLMDLIFL